MSRLCGVYVVCENKITCFSVILVGTGVLYVE